MSFPPPTQRQASILWISLTALAWAVLVGVIVMFVWGLGRVLDILSPVLWPLAVAGVIAYLLDPVVDFFERKRWFSRTRAIISVFVIGLFIVVGTLAIVVPPIVRQTHEFVKGVPDIAKKIEARVEEWMDKPPAWFQKVFNTEPKQEPQAPATSPEGAAAPSDNAATATTNTNAPPATASTSGKLSGAFGKETIQSVTTWVARLLPRASSRVFSWFGVLVGLSLIPIYSFYLLAEKRGIESKWTDYLPVKDSSFKNEVVFILSSINDYLIAFFRGQVLVAICDGILYGTGFLLIGLPYAILLGAAAVVLTIIPFIGAIIIFVTAMVIAFVQFGDWKHPLLVLAVFAVVQTLEGVVISPKIMQGRVGLHPLTIIVAVMVGTTLLGGILGGILAIPLTAVLRVLMARYVWKRPIAEKAS